MDNSSDESIPLSPAGENGSEAGDELQTILQYLLRSGQVHIIASDYEEDDDIFLHPPHIRNNYNMETLEKSDYLLTTTQSSGLVQNIKCRKHKGTNVLKMIECRQRGVFQSENFSASNKCSLFNRNLPNRMEQVAQLPGKVFCGVYSKDGKNFVSAWQDFNIRYYNTQNEKFELIKSIPGRDIGWSIIDIAFSPDGEYLVYSSWSESLHIFRLHSDSDHHEVLRLDPSDPRFCMFSVEFSSDGREILGGANDGNIYVYDRECNQRILRVHAHTDDANSVTFADSTSQILYSGGDDGLVKVWDRRVLNESDYKPVGILAGHLDGVVFIDSRDDGRYLISNSKDQSIKLWDIRVFSDSEAQKSTMKAVNGMIWDYRWQDPPTQFYDAKTTLKGDSSVMTYRGHTVLKTLIRCRFSPAQTTGQRYIYTGCATGRVVIYDSLTGKSHLLSGNHRNCVRDVSWHPHRQEIASSSWDGTIGLWKVDIEADRYCEQEQDDGSVFLGETKRGPTPLRRSKRLARRKFRHTDTNAS